jgi:hypothetical protein
MIDNLILKQTKKLMVSAFRYYRNCERRKEKPATHLKVIVTKCGWLKHIPVILKNNGD